MSRQLKVFCIATAICLSLMICSTNASAKSIAMGTGGLKGVYYPVGKAIAKLFNGKIQGTKIEVLSTQGSVQNIGDLISGKVGLGICSGRCCR